MRALLPLVLMLAPSLAWAADPDAAPLGSSCRSAADAALRAGSEPKYNMERMLRAGFALLERGRVPGEREQILYRCAGSAGVLVGYSIERSTRSEAVARRAYASALRQMQARFGRAISDSEQLTLPERLVRWQPYAAAFTANESSVWSGASAPLISVTLEKLRTSPDWDVITSDQPAMPAEGAVPSRGRRLITGALLVAVSSAAVVIALLMMPLARYRWVVALATPLALTYELHSTRDWLELGRPGGPGEGAASWDAVWFICGAAASALIAWRWRQGAMTRVRAPPVRGSAVPVVMTVGMVLFAALGVWMWAAFQPPHDTGGLATELRMDAAAPVTVVLATLLTVVGTGQMLYERASCPERHPAARRTTELLGVLVSIVGVTLCVNVLAEVVFAL